MKKNTKKKWIAFFLAFTLLISCFGMENRLLAASPQADIDARSEMVLYGDAERIDGDIIQLTPCKTWRSGGVWFPHQIDTSQDFSVSFSFWAGGGRGDYYNGADGIILCLSETKGLGGQGGSQGFVSGKKSYGVELDSYPHNSNDPSKKHVAILHDNVSTHLDYAADDRVDDSQWHDIIIDYRVQDNSLAVYLDDASKQSPIVYTKNISLATASYLGITAATGSGKNKHCIKNFYISGVISGEETFNNNPIVIIPGIMGSRLFTSNSTFNNDTKVWDPENAKQLSNLKDNVKGTLYVRPCENQNVDVNDPDYNGTVKEYGKEYGAQDTYKEVVDSLCKEFSYKKEAAYRPIYVFSYDWRKSNQENAKKLETEISNILTKENAEKVDFVCHSMGGLVASSYYSQYGSEKVEKIITCGTPYEGAPKVFNSVMNWDIIGQGAFGKGALKDDLLGILGGLTKKVKTSFNGVAELTPTENYVSGIAMQKDSACPFSYGDYKLTTEQYVKICKKIFGSTIYDSVSNFQKSLLDDDNFNKLASYNKAYFIIGTGYPTITSVKFQFINNELDELLYESDLNYSMEGDGTVPYYSASMREHTKNISPDRWYEINADHSGTIKTDDALKWINDILNTGSSNRESYKERIGEYTVIRVACPVDVVVEKDGEILSSDSEQLMETASFGRMDVLGANDEIKIFCVKGDSDYSVKIDGKATGTMDYSVRYYNGEDALKKTIEAKDIPVTATSEIRTSIDEDRNPSLQIDNNGDGIVDDTVELKEPDDPTYLITSANVKLSEESYIYDGKVKRPSVTVKRNDGRKIDSSNYTVSYAGGRKAVGTYKVTIHGIGEYSGSVTKSFVINPKGSSLSSVKASKKAFHAVWKKQFARMSSTYVTGYQLQYSQSSNFKNAKIKTVKGYKKTKLKVAKLKTKKKYYVRIRTYMKVNGKNYYSGWSKKKVVKVK